MMNDPLVSIVLPTYNRAAVLPLAIESVLQQSYRNFEIIIVDDNSKDNTSEIVHSFDDKRIRYVKNDPNLKLPKALNKGFSLAQGDYLTWTSDDNLLAPDAIEKMVRRLQTGDCDLVYADYYLFSELDTHNQPLDTQIDRLPDVVQLEKGNHIGACFMYTRQVYEEIGDYDPELFLVEDYDYFIRISKRFRLCHIPEALYYFRRDDNTLYCSRFCEVKASDFLVRYKNELLNEDKVMESVIHLLTRNLHDLKNPWFKAAYRSVKPCSYRLTCWLVARIQSYLRHRLHPAIMQILTDYRNQQTTFKEARDALSDQLQRFAQIQYTRN